MKNIIIGTAGHIDHGKTTLIKALTGKETDRLREEKQRGISIELGFTYFDLPSGRRAGIIDVPGHEKFIRHMLAGVGGIDIVMLVIAADEGVMPQTKEHLDILSLLTIKKGVIVITKANLVENEWIELVIEDIKEKVQGTFLQEAEVLVVDSASGMGIPELIKRIDLLTEETQSRDITAPTRMPIDRVFSITGFGTVVTGTLLEGQIHVEDILEILPQKLKVRVRNLQVHGESVKTAYAGQRVAINLANIKTEDIERGYVLAQLNSIEPTMMVDVKLRALKDGSRVLANRDRVRLYHGSTEIFARAVLLDREELLPNEETFVQLRLEETIAVKKGDHIVVRFYSPLETVGGAIVIDGNPKKHKRFDKKIIKELIIKEKGSPEEVLEKHIERHSNSFPDIEFLARLTAQQINDIKSMVNNLGKQNRILFVKDNTIIHTNYYSYLKANTKKILESYHQLNSLRLGMPKEEFKNKLLSQTAGKPGDELLELLEEDKIIKNLGKYISLYDFEIIFSTNQLEIKSLIEKEFLGQPYATPKLEDFKKSIPYKEQDIQQVIEIMFGKELIRVTNEIVLHKKAYDRSKEILKEYVNENESISLAEFRDLLNTSRKYATAILEHFDSIRYTKRLDDKRVLF